MTRKGSKLLNLLTVCRKAGKLELGFDPMKEALAGGKARAVITAEGLSLKTEKEVKFFAGKKNVPAEKADITQDDVYARLGKRAGILTVCDGGFAEKALAICGENAGSDTDL